MITNFISKSLQFIQLLICKKIAGVIFVYTELEEKVFFESFFALDVVKLEKFLYFGCCVQNLFFHLLTFILS